MPQRTSAALPAPWTRGLGTWPGSIALVVGGSAIYGAVLGSWHGSLLACYAAIKLPLVLLATWSLTLPFQLLLARSLGVTLSGRSGALLGLRCLATAAVLLGSLAPVAWFFTTTAPAPSPEARTTHNLLYLLHTCSVAACGLAGAYRLRRELALGAPSLKAAIFLWMGWTSIFAFVGGETAWALRPFVGNIYEPVRFVRDDALDGNVYEFLLIDVRRQITREVDELFD